MLLVVLSTYFFVRALESPSRNRYWVGYVFKRPRDLLASVYLPSHRSTLAFSQIRQAVPPAPQIMLTLPINAFTLRGGGQLDWVVEHPTAQMVLDFSKFFAGNAGLPLLGAFVAMCLVGLFWPAASQAPSSSSVNERWVVKLVGTWLLFPIAATLLISFFKPVFSVRYMAISAPALTLLAGHGMAKLDQVSFRLLSFRLRGLVPGVTCRYAEFVHLRDLSLRQ